MAGPPPIRRRMLLGAAAGVASLAGAGAVVEVVATRGDDGGGASTGPAARAGTYGDGRPLPAAMVAAPAVVWTSPARSYGEIVTPTGDVAVLRDGPDYVALAVDGRELWRRRAPIREADDIEVVPSAEVVPGRGDLLLATA